MNRHRNDDFQSKNHYADFDEHGNSLTGNRNSLSRYNPESSYTNSGQSERENRDSRRDTNAAHAYGDYSGGTPYGGGGSYEGGGSSYGHSYYGLSGNEGPRITQHDRHWDDSRQYDAYGDSEHYENRNRNFSDSFGRSSDGGYINQNRNRVNQNFNYYDDSYQNPQQGGRGRENRGSDQRFDNHVRSGYGNRSFDYRNEGMRRGTDRDRGYRDERSRYRSEEDRYHNERNENRNRFDRERDRSW